MIAHRTYLGLGGPLVTVPSPAGLGGRIGTGTPGSAGGRIGTGTPGVVDCPAVTMPLLPDDHYVAMLAVRLVAAESGVDGRAPVHPALFAPGTATLRTGPLTTMVDLVAGHTPAGPYGPTIDLRLQIFGPRPVEGMLLLQARPLRVGKRLIVAETLLSGAGAVAPFGRAITTFQHVHMGTGLLDADLPHAAVADASFDDVLSPRVRDERSLELDPTERIANGLQGTVQGGAQAFLAELATEHALGGGRRMVAADLDIRFLGRLRNGPLVATVRELPSPDGAVRATVSLTDGGEADKLVSHVTLTMTPAA